jgi:hypothetical protein
MGIRECRAHRWQREKAKPDITLTLKNKKDGHLKVIFYNCKAYFPKGNVASIEISLGDWDDAINNDCHAEIKAARILDKQPRPPEIEVKVRAVELVKGRILEDQDVNWKLDWHPAISIPLRAYRKHGNHTKKS